MHGGVENVICSAEDVAEKFSPIGEIHQNQGYRPRSYISGLSPVYAAANGSVRCTIMKSDRLSFDLDPELTPQ